MDYDEYFSCSSSDDFESIGNSSYCSLSDHEILEDKLIKVFPKNSNLLTLVHITRRVFFLITQIFSHLLAPAWSMVYLYLKPGSNLPSRRLVAPCPDFNFFVTIALVRVEVVWVFTFAATFRPVLFPIPNH